MISAANLEFLDQKLRVYDVDQGAWEQEPNGFAANARHVLTHLTKDMVGKDFSDVDLVRESIAPDSVQYALRLSRWSLVKGAYLAEVTDTEESVRSIAEKGLENLPWGFASFAGAVCLLAQNLHDMDHKKTRDRASKDTHDTMRSVSRLLIDSASIQSNQYGFSLVKAFDARLSVLRNRFNIPEPTKPQNRTRA